MQKLNLFLPRKHLANQFLDINDSESHIIASFALKFLLSLVIYQRKLCL